MRGKKTAGGRITKNANKEESVVNFKSFMLFFALYIASVALTGILAYLLEVDGPAGFAALATAVGGLLTAAAACWIKLQQSAQTNSTS
ncbi:MAG: hypothetical protein V3T70_09380 [Phycisphaerae bacterium]